MEEHGVENKEQYLSLKEYDLISVKILKRNRLPLSEDNIAFINEYMIMADTRYNSDVGLTREQFRGLYATYARKTIFKKFKKNKKKGVEYSLDFDILGEKGCSNGRVGSLIQFTPCKKQRNPVNILIDKEFVDSLRKEEYLTDQDKDCLIDYLTTNQKIKDIGVSNGLAKRQVYFKIKNAIKKIKKMRYKNE